MTDYRLLDQDDVDGALDVAREYLPDDAEIGLLSYTGGRAFGWGNEHHDIDLHGYIVHDDWFKKVHTDNHIYDLTLYNLESFNQEEGRWPTHRFKQFYDKSKPVYVHDRFDFDEFMSELEPSTVENVYPYSIQTQIGRLDHHFSARTALHSYKELLIPLHYLETGQIESNVVDDIETDLPGLDQCVRRYRDDESNDIDEELVQDELDRLFDELGDMI